LWVGTIDPSATLELTDVGRPDASARLGLGRKVIPRPIHGRFRLRRRLRVDPPTALHDRVRGSSTEDGQGS